MHVREIARSDNAITLAQKADLSGKLTTSYLGICQKVAHQGRRGVLAWSLNEVASLAMTIPKVGTLYW